MTDQRSSAGTVEARCPTCERTEAEFASLHQQGLVFCTDPWHGAAAAPHPFASASAEAAHTPLPWAATTRQGSWDWVIYSKADPNIEICQMFHDGTEDNETGEANAELIVRAVNALARSSAASTSAGTVEPKCLRCGYELREHTYNGACYGVCGKFVMTALDTCDHGLMFSRCPECCPLPRPSAESEPVAWLAEYDGHTDATVNRDTMLRWRDVFGRKITPLYAREKQA